MCYSNYHTRFDNQALKLIYRDIDGENVVGQITPVFNTASEHKWDNGIVITGVKTMTGPVGIIYACEGSGGESDMYATRFNGLASAAHYASQLQDPAHKYALNWDGTYLHITVDGNDVIQIKAGTH